MTTLLALVAAAPEAAATSISLSPLSLFLQADIVVKAVMIGLLLASIWTWAVIFGLASRLRSTHRQCETFEKDLWQADDMQRFHKSRSGDDSPSAQILSAAMAEWRKSTGQQRMKAEGTRDRLAAAMSSAVAAAVDRIGDRLNLLATVGAVAPFVGLFGTVWGIMRSFTAIAGEQNTSLAVVAPGIAEALFATAMGLFAAIPAVIAYNRLSHGVNKLEGRLNRFADALHNSFSRQLEG